MKQKHGRLKKINAEFECTFRTPYLAIMASLVGKTHEFNYKGLATKLSLPNDDIKTIIARSLGDLKHSNRLTTYGWSDENDQSTYFFYVSEINLAVRLRSPISIHKDMLTLPPRRDELLTPTKVNNLDAVADKYQDTAKEVFRYWLRIMRWTKKEAMIGRFPRRDVEQTILPAIRSKKDGHRVWTPVARLTSVGTKPITDFDWNKASDALKRGLDSPLYYEYYFDGMEHLREQDNERAVVDFAVASEVYLRSKVISSVPNSLSSKIMDYVVRANINQYVTHFFPEILSDKGKKAFKGIKNSLSALLDQRNNVLHSGKLENTSTNRLEKFKDLAKTLLEFDDNPGYWKSTAP